MTAPYPLPRRPSGAMPLPDVLFDGMAVLRALSPEAARRTCADNVSDVLDALVRLMRSEATAGSKVSAAPQGDAAIQDELRALRSDLAEADRRAGAAERLLEAARSTLVAFDRARREMKAQAGYDDRVSFDIVWAETLARARANKPLHGDEAPR